MVSWWKSRDSLHINTVTSHHAVQHQHPIMQQVFSDYCHVFTFTIIKERNTLKPIASSHHVWFEACWHTDPSLNTSHGADRCSITSCETADKREIYQLLGGPMNDRWLSEQQSKSCEEHSIIMYRGLIVPETFENVLKIVILMWIKDYELNSF